MKEIWCVSADPERGRRSAPQLLGWWWGLWLSGNISGSISERLAPSDADTLDAVELYGAFAPGIFVGTISAVLTIASAVCLLMIVRQITQAQETWRDTSHFEG
jgi:hypothetical protein